jgi:speckle-type POZ protein
MLATGVGGHVTFQVGKEAFVAHKNVLAVRSPVFMAKFFGGMKEEKAAAARVRIFGWGLVQSKVGEHNI